MKHLLKSMRLPVAISAVVFAVGLLAPSAKADQWNKRTILTVNETIQVQDTVLQPGQYVFRLLDSNSDRHVVQIFNRRENHIYATILAIPSQRLEPTGRTEFTFWETPAGTARAMKDWYYPGDLFGSEFLYPKHPYQLVAMSQPAPPPPAPPAAEPAPAPATQPSTAETQPAENPTPEAAPPQPAPEQAAPPPQPEPAPAPPEQLPHTSSPYPLVGLAGVVLLAFGGLLRLRRLPLR